MRLYWNSQPSDPDAPREMFEGFALDDDRIAGKPGTIQLRRKSALLTSEGSVGPIITATVVPHADSWKSHTSDELAAALTERSIALRVAPRSALLEVIAQPSMFFQNRGFRAVHDAATGAVILRPPTRESSVAAASIALVDPGTSRILLGQRKTRTWNGYWAFPGGKRDAGEALFETGLRELREETGVHVEQATSALRTTVYVSDGRGGPVYCVDNFLVLGAHVVARESDELLPRWMTFVEARDLSPVAAGTARVLRLVLQYLSA